MKQVPLPAHIHYELLLQVLERQTFAFVEAQDYSYRQRVQELINSLRKAFSQQQQMEENWRSRGYLMDYRWSIEEDT